MRNRSNKTAGPARKCLENKRASEKGFTLIETAIAMVVMAIVGLGAASAFFYAASNTANAADREMATAVAQQRIEQLRNVAFADATLIATSVSGVATTVTRGGRTYSIVTTIADSNVVNGAPTLKTITIQVIPQAANQSWATSTTSLFGSVTLVSERSAPVLGPNRAL
jgi:prepilin-type N-terminal cleavage/methylation domain-containing protein